MKKSENYGHMKICSPCPESCGGNKDTCAIIKRRKDFNYALEQLKSIMPIDEYHAHFQVRTTNGHTKWMILDNSSLEALRRIVYENV